MKNGKQANSELVSFVHLQGFDAAGKKKSQNLG